jgi:hypothetical protein
MRSLVRDFLVAVGWYVALIAVGSVVILTLCSLVGYLPYSDRPGPGWVGPSFSIGQLEYYASWGVLLLIPTVIYGSALFAYHRLLRFLGTPAFLIRLVAGLSGAVIAFVLSAGVGWYIAIAAFPVWVAAILGGVWGSGLAATLSRSAQSATEQQGSVGADRARGWRGSAGDLRNVLVAEIRAESQADRGPS